jgi:hypothetical protein
MAFAARPRIHDEPQSHPVVQITMSNPSKPISIFPAAAATAAAVFELAACFLTVRSHSSLGSLNVMLLAEMILIAAAIAQWVAYFRRYITQQIEERLPRPQDKRGDISN